MSRSTRKPYIKDKPRNVKRTKLYWSRVRSVHKSAIKGFRGDLEELDLPNPKTIINDYDYCDWTYYNDLDEKWKRK